MEILINDGFRADWVETALFSGIMEIPIIRKQDTADLPKELVPFTIRNRVDGNDELVCFYEHDEKFYEFINNPDEFIGDLQKFKGVISPDCSLYILAINICYSSKPPGSNPVISKLSNPVISKLNSLISSKLCRITDIL